MLTAYDFIFQIHNVFRRGMREYSAHEKRHSLVYAIFFNLPNQALVPAFDNLSRSKCKA